MKTLVLGASPNADRYSYKAAILLKKYNHEVMPVGIKQGKIADMDILTGMPAIENVHTITLYVGADNQKVYYDYILTSHAQRIIFNPGTENLELKALAEKKNIECVEGCTLVMLQTGQF